tara:strand:+ start:44479 stop:44724 length:246 start_codon:yes stop_codon:yes gene_type:complete
MEWRDILKDDPKEHPMERKKRLKKEKKEIRARDEANCRCPRKPDGSYDLKQSCPCKFFKMPDEKYSSVDLLDGDFWNQKKE